MTDTEINYLGMALNVLKLLREAKPRWEPLYQKLVPDYTALETSLFSFDDTAKLRVGVASTG